MTVRMRAPIEPVRDGPLASGAPPGSVIARLRLPVATRTYSSLSCVPHQPDSSGRRTKYALSSEAASGRVCHTSESRRLFFTCIGNETRSAGGHEGARTRRPKLRRGMDSATHARNACGGSFVSTTGAERDACRADDPLASASPRSCSCYREESSNEGDSPPRPRVEPRALWTLRERVHDALRA